MKTQDELIALYTERHTRYSQEAERVGVQSHRISNLRGLTFGAAVIASFVLLFSKTPGVAAPIGGVSALAFLGLVVWHNRVSQTRDLALRFSQVNREALACVTNHWRTLPRTGVEGEIPDSPFAGDLDLFGPASLFQKICAAQTRQGQQRLAQMLTEQAPLDVIRARQQAVQELQPLLELRQHFEALAATVVDDPSLPARPETSRPPVPNPEPFLKWAESKPQLLKNRFLVWAVRILPILTNTLFLFGNSLGLNRSYAVACLLFQGGLWWHTREETSRVFGIVSSRQGAFLRFGNLLAELEQLQLQSPLLQKLQLAKSTGHTLPSSAMRQFARFLGWFELRYNGLVHPFADLFLLWDTHCVLGLERWQQQFGHEARSWLELIGEFEALSSLAGLAHDEPEFTFPELSEAIHFEAQGLGHPLIGSHQRVSNDVSLPQAGTALLITGSNMSGKSTLLRAMGLSGVMAFAGGPVCARSLKLGRMQLATSLRISDSLEQGVSHFYAEIGKLKTAVTATSGDKPVFFLLDEILHGTNSRERQIGAKWVLATLLEHGALGAISTHDLGLCELPAPLMQRVQIVHFRESVNGSEMTFDYKLQPGPVKAGNALRLMQRIGLNVPLE